MGLESSGTRFVSRAIAEAIQPNMTWDGQEGEGNFGEASWSGPCFHWHSGDAGGPKHQLAHVSLPHGMWCTHRDLAHDVQLMAHADICHPFPPGTPERWVANVTSTLLATRPAGKAIIVTRSPVWQRLSAMVVHGCTAAKADPNRAKVERAKALAKAMGKLGTVNSDIPDPDPIHVRKYKAQLARRREDAVSRRSIAEALANPAVRDRILLVPYDELSWLSTHHWRRIAAHIGLGSGVRVPPGFRNFSSGDGRWLTHEHLGDMIRAAAEPSASWNEVALEAALAHHARLPPNATDGFVNWWAGTGQPAPLDAAAAFNVTRDPHALAGGFGWRADGLELASWVHADAAVDGTAAGHGYTDAEVKAQVEDARWAQMRRDQKELGLAADAARVRAMAALAAVIACVLLCVLPSPCHAHRVRARLQAHAAPLTLSGAPSRHLGVTLGAPTHSRVPFPSAVEVLAVADADLFGAAGVCAGDLILSVDGAPPHDASEALAALEAAVEAQRAEAAGEAQRELSVRISVVRADAARCAVDEAARDATPLWFEVWHAVYSVWHTWHWRACAARVCRSCCGCCRRGDCESLTRHGSAVCGVKKHKP